MGVVSEKVTELLSCLWHKHLRWSLVCHTVWSLRVCFVDLVSLFIQLNVVVLQIKFGGGGSIFMHVAVLSHLFP